MRRPAPAFPQCACPGRRRARSFASCRNQGKYIAVCMHSLVTALACHASRRSHPIGCFNSLELSRKETSWQAEKVDRAARVALAADVAQAAAVARAVGILPVILRAPAGARRPGRHQGRRRAARLRESALLFRTWLAPSRPPSIQLRTELRPKAPLLAACWGGLPPGWGFPVPLFTAGLPMSPTPR